MKRAWAAGTVVLAVALGGCSGSGSGPAAAGRGTPDTEASPTSAPARSVPTPDSRHVVGRGVGAPDVTAAVDTVGRAMAGIDAVLATPAAAGTLLDDDVLVGAAREALLSQATEYADNGWTVRGKPRIVRMVVHHAAAGGLQVRACVDQSAVQVVDRTGRALPPGAATPRTWMIYRLAPAGDGWQVTDQTFPDDPDC